MLKKKCGIFQKKYWKEDANCKSDFYDCLKEFYTQLIAEEEKCPDDYNSVLAKIESYLKPQKQMLDALIGYCINYESNDHNSKLMGGAWYNHFLEIIESVTGNPWEKIKKELE
jgi:hypothetical protein